MAETLKILLLEGIHPSAVDRLKEAGFAVESQKGAMSEAELIQCLPNYQALGIRSKTHLSARAIAAGKDLQAIGAFCIGTNQIDLESANVTGIPVFNAPYSNTRSVAELVIAELISLSRYLGDVSRAAHKGEWHKSAKGAREVRGKTLGIVGYGHIGSQVSILAEALGLRVFYFDIVKKLPLGNARPMDSLGDLLAACDFVTLHVPETPMTRNMIGAAEIKRMKAGSYLLNLSRGTVVDLKSLRDALNSGQLAGAAVDVFPHEPQSNDERFESELQGLRNVILTPHIGGSTEEAQESIGHEVAESLVRVLSSGTTLGAVNFPQLDCPPLPEGNRLVNVHHNVPGVLSEINGIVSRAGANIKAQYLSTDPKIGYLVMDLERANVAAIADQVARLKTSIRTRLI